MKSKTNNNKKKLQKWNHELKKPEYAKWWDDSFKFVLGEFHICFNAHIHIDFMHFANSPAPEWNSNEIQSWAKKNGSLWIHAPARSNTHTQCHI